ncbi:unnamed protein product [Moneuplotes crassus]|uniref:Uncharacterized protein n=1 Tax=Euplotes crassus TaxID=5936 RepID=A0AAD1UAK0_EUPCR|nr:unnamed protein product [Moneuplotes crassus]
MDRAEAFGTSKVVVDKIKERKMKQHLKEIRCAKSLLDNSIPNSMRLRKSNPKKERMLEERYTEIERANRILLEKMANIIGNKKFKHHRYKPKSTKFSSSFFMPGIEVKSSLNSGKRKRELSRINFENDKLLKRLQDKKPTYDIVRWAKDRRKNERIIQNISTYPTMTRKRHQSVPRKRLVKIKHAANKTQNIMNKKGFQGIKELNNSANASSDNFLTSQPIHDVFNKTNAIDASQQTMYANKGRMILDSNFTKIKKKIRPFPTQPNSISTKRILLFEKKQRIGKKDYLVEVSRDKLHMFIIAFLIENPKYYTLQIPMKQAFKLLLDLENSFEALIGLLYFKHKRLVLPDIFRPQFSPRNMAVGTRTTTNKDSQQKRAFDGGFYDKGTISEATASRPALENDEFVKPLIESQNEEDTQNVVETGHKPVETTKKDPEASSPAEEEKDEEDDQYNFDFEP